MNTNSNCRSCQVEAGTLTSEADRTHRDLWGCTCRTEDSEEAQEWMRKVTK